MKLLICACFIVFIALLQIDSSIATGGIYYGLFNRGYYYDPLFYQGAHWDHTW